MSHSECPEMPYSGRLWHSNNEAVQKHSKTSSATTNGAIKVPSLQPDQSQVQVVPSYMRVNSERARTIVQFPYSSHTGSRLQSRNQSYTLP